MLTSPLPAPPAVASVIPDAPVTAKAPLRARESTPLNLSATLGKSMLVAASTPLAARGGYYCDVCTCLLKDSQTYLDHINGRKHQKKLGMTMKVNAAVGVDEVRDRMRQWQEKREGEEGGKAREAGRKRKRAGGEAEGEAGDDSKQGEDEDESERDNVHTAGEPLTEERKDSANEAASSGTGKVATKEPSGDVRPAELDRTAEEEEESMMAAMGFNFAAFGGSKKT